MKIEHKSEYIPILLMGFYIVLFFFTGLDTYAEKYDTYIVFIDTFMLALGILYYLSDGRKWTFLGKKSLLTAISLNVLTEMSFIFGMPQYYGFYFVIICVYLLVLVGESYVAYKNNLTKDYDN